MCVAIFLGNVLLLLRVTLFPQTVFYGFRITLFPQKPQFSPNERRARLSVHKGVECNLEEFVRNTKQKRLSFTVWIRSKNQAIYQQVNTSSWYSSGCDSFIQTPKKLKLFSIEAKYTIIFFSNHMKTAGRANHQTFCFFFFSKISFLFFSSEFNVI